MKTIKTLFIAVTFATLGTLSVPAWAAGSMDPSQTSEMKAPQGDASYMTDAEVRKVDMAQGKVTLKHGEIKNLDMPPMTMVFTVTDKAMLDGVKPGDKVKFKAANESGKMMVVEMAPAN